ncbi:mannosyl-glycoprotein endo-beta-N-acetylglucosamidase [Paenibacillus spiritus]|uniref:Mannosyl-glycoprotein endo-beta-N-acetylglucosamidase n=1 Tax=Paenibacillus spiritus TaxID=2496557 RepID=A0A5J5G953_9BACL|nr:glucosaminidase domain-containing protein [Paenibacillus spiritus]KAA9004131.1 mannosyl-glycoprotein endo-beta-N-acetylglucosamidase [Paenibacillus spiritus]
MKPASFIAKLAPYAMQDMIRTGVPASLTIAQGALESAWGASGLTARANNLFGIKGNGPAGSVTMATTEYVNGRAVTINAAFKAYHNWGEAVSDHSALLVNGTSWNRKQYAAAVGTDGRSAARAVAAAGYATDPNYAQQLIRLIDTYDLEQYDAKAEEENGMSVEDRKRLAELEKRLAEMQEGLAALGQSRDTLKGALSEQGNTLKLVLERVAALEDKTSMEVPNWAEAAVTKAVAAGLIDSPSGASYDFYRILTVLNRAGLLAGDH